MSRGKTFQNEPCYDFGNSSNLDQDPMFKGAMNNTSEFMNNKGFSGKSNNKKMENIISKGCCLIKEESRSESQQSGLDLGGFANSIE